jgi:tetratricopeptide (TPR) repeat protein
MLEPPVSNLFNEPNEEVYDQLISLIETTQGRLAPILVGCDDAQLRQRAIARYETEAAQSKIRSYRIELGREPSVRAALMALRDREAHLRNGGAAVFSVTGAELLLRIKMNAADEQSDLDKFFGYLQWTREGLQEFRYPIVIWVSHRILNEMSVRAPDFWSWRKAVLRFVDESLPSFEMMPSEPRSPSFEQQTDEFLPPVAELQAEIDQLMERDAEAAGLATLYERLGKVYARRVERGEAENLEDERERAIEAFQEAIGRYQRHRDLSGQAGVLTDLGNFLSSQSRYREAIDFHRQSLEIARQAGDLKVAERSLNNLGNEYHSLCKYHRSIDFHQQSLEITRQIGNRKGEAISLSNLGNAHYSLRQYHQAIELYQQSLEITRQIGNRKDEASPVSGLGAIYGSLGEYRRSIEFYQQALEIQRQIGNRRGEADSLLNTARSLAKLDRRWEARQHYEQALQIYEELKLDHEVERCKDELYSLGQIIPSQVNRAPEIGEPTPPPDWLKKSMPTPSAPPRPRKRSRMPWWVWFCVGLAIVVAIVWLLKG